ncbi:alpha/beta fold hydrolase [Pelagibacterium limicola]|uniref:alpha/beta fold hydrolase n=1 Tax=Pelagibacterium limicola TaxID=2791022 RepID=UPI0018AFCA95|nr:alpha/beta hydrolase [Pelagibacterium limicola]
MSNARPTTYVLVPGAGHGGWVWRKLADKLRADGHSVYSLTLTGLGERSHLMSGEIDLQTHVNDVVNVFLWEDLHDVVLVGHSYAGWVITQAIEEIEGRVRAIVYLDAFLPDHGDRGYDFLNEQQKAAFDEARARNEVSRPGPNAAALRIQNPEDAAWLDSKVTPQPIGVSLQPLELTGARERIAKKVYVRTPLFPQPLFDAAFERCQNDTSWDAIVLEECGHDPMVDCPEKVREILIAV